MEEKKRKKQEQQQAARVDHWLQPNIVVKVVTKRLGEKYHKKKAVITVIGPFRLQMWQNVSGRM